MEVSIEKLVENVVREVLAELSKRGITIIPDHKENLTVSSFNARRELSELIDLKNYKTPVLTESQIVSLDSGIREIVLPKGTVITPGAREIIARRRIIISSNHKTN